MPRQQRVQDRQLSVPQLPYPGVAGRMSGAAGIGICGVTATVTLPAGVQTLTLNQDNGGWNINYFAFAGVL